MDENIKVLTLNSSLSSNSSISNPAYFLNTSLYNVSGYSVQNFSTVNTCYNIDSRNNQISFIENAGPITTSLPKSNYTINTFLTQLGLSMSASGTYTYTATVNSLTNLITVTLTGAFKFLVTPNNAYYEFGMTVLSPTLATAQTSSASYDLSGLKQIHVVCSLFGFGNTVVSGSNYNIICTINVNEPYHGVIGFTNSSSNFITSSTQEVSSLQFTLLDERSRPISLQNDWTLSLYIKQF